MSVKRMDNPKVIIGKSKFGKGLFAKENIKKNEIIAVFDGTVYVTTKASKLPSKVKNHAIQIAKNKWIDSKGVAHYINHSCNPNCGIKNLVNIVAIRNIKKGKELFIDYDMTENSNWVIECKCREKNCRKIIHGFRFLPERIKRKYKGYISEWLVKDI